MIRTLSILSIAFLVSAFLVSAFLVSACASQLAERRGEIDALSITWEGTLPTPRYIQTDVLDADLISTLASETYAVEGGRQLAQRMEPAAAQLGIDARLKAAVQQAVTVFPVHPDAEDTLNVSIPLYGWVNDGSKPTGRVFVVIDARVLLSGESVWSGRVLGVTAPLQRDAVRNVSDAEMQALLLEAVNDGASALAKQLEVDARAR